MKPAAVIWLKEIKDALRDRKTLLIVLFTSVLMGPEVLISLSFLFAQVEQSREQRIVYAVNSEASPTLVNFFQRQSFEVKAAPTDYASQIKSGAFNAPVLVVPDTFETKFAQGEDVEVGLVYSSTNRGAAAGASQVRRLMSEFRRERGSFELAKSSVAPSQLKGVDVNDQDLSGTQSNAAQFTSILPMFILMAILYGALNAAVDTTAGERERGSLEPLLMNPANSIDIILGKWGAVAALAMLSALLAVLSFFPAQWLIQTESLKAMFNFGWSEAVGLLLVLLPFGAAASGLFMAISLRCKSFKEAYANNTALILALSLAPMVTLFDQQPERPLYWWIPALGQQLAMNRVLRNEPTSWDQFAIPALICALLTLFSLLYMQRTLRRTVVQ
jgi:sodium transport system permease protein